MLIFMLNSQLLSVSGDSKTLTRTGSQRAEGRRRREKDKTRETFSVCGFYAAAAASVSLVGKEA
jgi:hypothetical protein